MFRSTLICLFILCSLTVLSECSPLRFHPQLPSDKDYFYSNVNSNTIYTLFYGYGEKFSSSWINDAVGGKIGCDLCEMIVGILQKEVEKGSSEEEIVKLATEICIAFNIEDERVCTGMIQEFKVEFLYVLDNLVLSPKEVCGLWIGDECAVPYDPKQFWNVTFPSIPKPPVQKPIPPKSGSPTIRILHLTDFHTDMEYMIGANTKCGEPICCRQGDGPPHHNETGAGKWGDFNCDIPYRTLENLFQHLNKTQSQFDMIYFTGDIPPHNIWNQSQSDQLTALENVTKLFLKYLPTKPVYHAVGNHESAPVNSYPPPFIKGNNSITWLYSALAKSWLQWLPKNTTADILRGAYYTVSPFPGFRIISLNMNYCNQNNWWLFLNTTDPAGQLQWLISVLQHSETNGEKVHILGHIHPGSGHCLKAFDWNYYKIINRYENTVAGQYFGHMHRESFQMIYDDVNFTRPLGVVYIPGSVTTHTGLNSGFRIYEVDGNYRNSSWYALGYQNFIMNITEANLSDDPKWIFEYDPKEDLIMKNLYPEDWDELIYRMKDDDALFQKYYRYQWKSVEKENCVGECKSKVLCGLKKGRSHDDNPDLCKGL